jgi:catechol 2,3-dioxygenase-like lactoylglutathione lyase family enzyme
VSEGAAERAAGAASGQVLAMGHTGFTVADIERSIAFYRDQLGLLLISQQEGQRPYLSVMTGFPGVYLKTAFLKVTPEAEHVLELLEYTSHPGEPTPRETNRPGNGHICLRVAEIQALYTRLSAAGVTFISPPEPITSGVNAGAVACYLRDPDGFTVELIQPPARRE